MADKSLSKVSIPLARTSGLPPQGIYRCVIRKVDLNDGASGYPYMACECGIDDPKQAEWSGRTFYTNLSLSPQARWKMEEALESLGAPEDGTIDSTGWFMGKRFYAFLSHSEYEGRKRLQVEEFIARDEVKERLAAWVEKAAEIEAETKAAKKIAQDEAAALAPDIEDEEPVAEFEEQEDEDLEQVLDDLDDLWED